MVIVNRVDAEGVDLAAVLEEIREVFGPECLPLNLPAVDDEDGGELRAADEHVGERRAPVPRQASPI